MSIIKVDKNIVITQAIVTGINYIVELLKETPVRRKLTEKYGKVWNQKELKKDFKIIKFGENTVYVQPLEEHSKPGILHFNVFPRYYFNFQEL